MLNVINCRRAGCKLDPLDPILVMLDQVDLDRTNLAGTPAVRPGTGFDITVNLHDTDIFSLWDTPLV
ncbi:MAG: hypothetical protein ABFC78_01560, partial [Methanoregula sp.]